MRYTEYFNQPSPELGETADITVVTNAILAGEKNQSGKVESMKATFSGNIVSLTSQSRTSKLTKYYNGLSFTFYAPSALTQSDVLYQLKVDDLTPQPFKVKTAINKDELVTIIFDNIDGFISINHPVPRSSAIDSDSEITVATSKAVKKINDIVKKVDLDFRNFCPYAVGDIYITTNPTNPSTKYLGTTWQKIEGRFLLGTTGDGLSKQTGGSMSKTIGKENLPSTKISIDSIAFSRGSQEISGYTNTGGEQFSNYNGGVFTAYGIGNAHWHNANRVAVNGKVIDFKASRNWTGLTSSASPQTYPLGNGVPLDISPSYYTCHIWLRLT